MTIAQVLETCFNRRESMPTYSGTQVSVSGRFGLLMVKHVGKLPSLGAAYESGLRLPHFTLMVPVYKEGLEA
jgi:hypothetical protein